MDGLLHQMAVAVENDHREWSCCRGDQCGPKDSEGLLSGRAIPFGHDLPLMVASEARRPRGGGDATQRGLRFNAECSDLFE